MTKHKVLSIQEKEERLLKKIQETQQKLTSLQERRKMECGELIFRYGLHKLDNGILEKACEKLAHELSINA